uniref:Uncharacterized protein n=1 Tax=Theileria annulata TaxID=5874 RepID=A0A3B0N634_THEAN
MSIFLNIINNTIDKYKSTSTSINSFDVNSNLDTNGEMEVVYSILEIIDIVDLNLLQKIITLLSFNIKLNVTVYKKLYSYLSNIGIFNLLYIFYNFRYLVKTNSANLALQSTGYRELNLEFNKMIMKWVKENGLDQFINYLLSNTLQVNIIVSVLYNFFDHVTQDNEYPELKNQILTNQNILNGKRISTGESILTDQSILMYLYGNDQIVNLLMKLEEKLEENSQGFDCYKLYINELNLILLSLNGAELRLFKGNSHLGRLSFSELVTNNPEMLQDVKNILLKTLTQVNISHVMKCLIDEYVQMNSSGLDFITVVNFGIFTSDNIIYNISILLLQSFDFNITLLLTTLDNLALVDTSVNELSPVDTTINSKSLDTSINNSKSLDTSLRRGNLYRLIIVYVYFNYNFVNGGDLDMINDIFNNYIINILKEINSTDSGNSKTNDKEEELLVNIMVMKCIYVYNIIMNSYNDKVISIYYNILNNNIQMFNNNNVFIYKIEVLLSIIIDLLYNKRDSNQNQEVSIGLPIELKVYRLILNILTYDLRISAYIYNLILNKLLYKLLLVLSIRNDITVNSYKSSDESKRTNVVSSVNDMLKDYFIVIMEMILFDEKLNTNSLSILFTTIFNLYTHNTGNYLGNSGDNNSLVNSGIVNSDTDGTTRMLLVESIKYLISNSLQYYIMNVEPSSVGSFSGIISRLKLLMINCNEGIAYNVTILLIIFVNYKMNVMEIYDIIKWVAKAELASELGDLYSLLHFYNVNINASKKLSNLLSSVKALVNPKTNSVPNVRHIQTITEKYNMNNDPSPFCRHLFN